MMENNQVLIKKKYILKREQKALYYIKQIIPIYLIKTALRRTSNAIFNMKIDNLDKS